MSYRAGLSNECSPVVGAQHAAPLLGWTVATEAVFLRLSVEAWSW